MILLSLMALAALLHAQKTEELSLLKQRLALAGRQPIAPTGALDESLDVPDQWPQLFPSAFKEGSYRCSWENKERLRQELFVSGCAEKEAKKIIRHACGLWPWNRFQLSAPAQPATCQHMADRISRAK